MMEHVGHPVFALTRTAFGPVTLKVRQRKRKRLTHLHCIAHYRFVAHVYCGIERLWVGAGY
jgi:16S rRNA U516 pseudouridylate synthase RsuA-like enzyme